MEKAESNIIYDNPEKEKNVIKIISVTKYIILAIVTFGLYDIWWIYKSWRFFRDKEKSDIMPAFRTIFSIIFLIPLFNKILKLSKSKGYEHDYNEVLPIFKPLSFIS